MKKGLAFMEKYPAYNATVHALGGIGIGILLTSLITGFNPVLWGIVFVILSFLGHVYAWFA